MTYIKFLREQRNHKLMYRIKRSLFYMSIFARVTKQNTLFFWIGRISHRPCVGFSHRSINFNWTT